MGQALINKQLDFPFLNRLCNSGEVLISLFACSA